MNRAQSFLSGLSVGIIQLLMCASLVLATPQSADAHDPIYAYRVYFEPDCRGLSVVVYDGWDWLVLVQQGVAKSFRVNRQVCANIP